MKKTMLILCCCLTTNLFSQIKKDQREQMPNKSITIGILQGGGSLVGADLELLLTDRFGMQFGAGFLGFGAGINYHFKPSIRSSYVSLQYWNQGIGESFAQNVLGPNYVFRGKKWFTFQIGAGATLDKGPAYPTTIKQEPVILMYSIGGYIPIK